MAEFTPKFSIWRMLAWYINGMILALAFVYILMFILSTPTNFEVKEMEGPMVRITAYGSSSLRIMDESGNTVLLEHGETIDLKKGQYLVQERGRNEEVSIDVR